MILFVFVLSQREIGAIMKPAAALDQSEWYSLKNHLWEELQPTLAFTKDGFIKFMDDVGFQLTLHSGEGCANVAAKHGIPLAVAEFIFRTIELKAKEKIKTSLTLGLFCIVGAVSWYFVAPSKYAWAHSWWALACAIICAMTGVIHVVRGITGLKFRIPR